MSKISKLEDEQIPLLLAKKGRIEDFPLFQHRYLRPNPMMISEMDVALAANLEWICWVSLLLEQVSGLPIRTLAKSYPEDNDNDDCDDYRSVMTRFYVILGPGNSVDESENWKPFAILTIKRTKMIDIDGFQPAIPLVNKGNGKICENYQGTFFSGF